MPTPGQGITVMTQSTPVRPPAVAPHAPRAWQREAGTLLARALDAFHEGRTAAAPPRAGLTDGQLNEELLAYVYGRLPATDHASLARLGGAREQALSLSRAGKQEEAEATMKLARFLLSVAGFSPLGRAAADTLHHAAEAYLSYRRGDFADANARMAASVAATDRLADAWGESLFTTARRVHLLHNQMKVEARRGARREAVTLGAGVLAHLAGCSSHPGIPTLARPASALDPVIAIGLCDTVAATVAEALVGIADAEAKELLGLFAGVVPHGAATEARAWGWLPVKSASLADDPRGFLEAAAPFLRAGRGRAPVLWYAVTLDVVRAARKLGPGAVPDGVAEIEAMLSTGPRVPTCMQAAARSGLS